MFIFEKRTQMPVRIHNKNPKLAGFILTQYGGPEEPPCFIAPCEKRGLA
ncbi:MAG: hypothetical protein LBC82_05240 [Oscillospiraceae bacterium]|nr:hypothetical protein [Oscillospiraceae bacterium]